MKFKIQPVIIVLAILSLGAGILQILQTKTMILPPWFLLLFSLPCVLLISLVLGFLIKKLLNSPWHVLTFTSLFIIIFCAVFYIDKYRPVYTIVVPKEYAGEIKLLVSNEKENDFLINRYGIGYINRKTFDEGFYPKIIKGDNEITKQVKEYSKAAFATTLEDIYSYEYLSFYILGDERMKDIDIEELIKIKGIDTARLYKK